MSVWVDWKITMELEGEWSKKTINDLNTAMNGWWNFCDYAGFFSRIKFSTRKRSVSTTGYSNKINFDKLVNFAANGDDKYLLKNGWTPLEKRDRFDPEDDFLVTGKLCGDWSEESIKMLNETMDYVEKAGRWRRIL